LIVARLARNLQVLAEAGDGGVGDGRHQDGRRGGAGGEEAVGEIDRRHADRRRDDPARGETGNVALERIDREVAAVDQIAEIGERAEGERHAAAFQEVERLLARGDVGDETVAVSLERPVAGVEHGVGGGSKITERHL
jgi:hypothetical protein